MTQMRHFITVLLAMLLAGAASAAIAQEVQETGGFLSGGIGQESRAEIEAQQAGYNTKFFLVGAGGIYLSDVALMVRNAAGEVVASTVTEGPIALVNLPAGRYTAEATIGEVTAKATLQAGKAQRSYYLRFPIADTAEAQPMDTDVENNDAYQKELREIIRNEAGETIK